MLTITLEGSARERGVSQGAQLKDRIQAAKKSVFYSRVFKEMKPKLAPVPLAIWGLSKMGKNRTKEYIEKYIPRQHEKMIGIAEGAGEKVDLVYGMNYVEIMAGNPKNSYAKPLVQACTMVFALGKSTADGSIIYGRNYDFPQILQPYQMARVEKPTDGYKNINLSQYPTAGTHVGLNDKGLAIGYNYGRSWKTDPLDYSPRGVPTMLIVQEALETCKTVQEVVDLATKMPRTNGAHLGIVDESGDACVLETTATRHAVRKVPEGGVMAHSNMYHVITDANVPDDVMWKFTGLRVPYTKSPKERVARAAELIEGARGKVSVDTIKSILTDHAGREPDDFTICTHGLTGATLASVIIKPKELGFWATDNQPCKTKYEKISF
ncbi:MAG: linear amide C-N hydrolase [Candidatus Lokiarchaeota archaeon]|nr:linear amide C-N hydrolase [Candidatus Lokiarchaeota archaeon]